MATDLPLLSPGSSREDLLTLQADLVEFLSMRAHAETLVKRTASTLDAREWLQADLVRANAHARILLRWVQSAIAQCPLPMGEA